LLKLAKEPVMKGMPALISLLYWAVEEAAEKYDLDASQARPVLEGLQDLVMSGYPKQAVNILLNQEDPEDEFPSELLAKTPEEAAGGIISLASQARAM
jgi:hypothetical protein